MLSSSLKHTKKERNNAQEISITEGAFQKNSLPRQGQILPRLRIADVEPLHPRHVAVVRRLVQRKNDAHVGHRCENNRSHVENEVETALKPAIVSYLFQDSIENSIIRFHRGWRSSSSSFPFS